MTNDVTTMEHQRIQDEALDLVFAAVEPADRPEYDSHLADCDQCREFVDELTSLVGLVGAVGDVEAPPPSLRAAILAEAGGLSVTRPAAPGALGAEPADDASASGSPFAAPCSRGRRRAHRSTIAAAATRVMAVAAVLALIGVVGWGAAMRAQRDDAQKVAAGWQEFHDAISRPGDLTVAEIDGADGDSTKRLAVAYIRASGTFVVADAMAENDTGDSIYVLWSLASPTDGAPVALGSFDVSSDRMMSYVATTGAEPSGRWFAISEEPGRRVPDAPTHVLGAGEAG